MRSTTPVLCLIPRSIAYPTTNGPAIVTNVAPTMPHSTPGSSGRPADTVVVGDVELECVAVDLVADERVASSAVSDREVVPQGTPGGLDEADPEDRDAPGVQRRAVAVDDAAVDRLLDEERCRDRRRLP